MNLYWYMKNKQYLVFGVLLFLFMIFTITCENTPVDNKFEETLIPIEGIFAIPDINGGTSSDIAELETMLKSKTNGLTILNDNQKKRLHNLLASYSQKKNNE